MKQKLLTIIVPTYNMETCLSRGLDSLIVDKQIMPLLEVLVVNDGSTDHSSQIAHQYQEKYSNVFHVIDKENGNYGSAINVGLREAHGEYVRIMDADDWYDTPEFANFILELSQMSNIDMILNDYQMVSKEGNVIQNCKYALPYGRINFQEYPEKEYFALPSITYRTQMLRDINYKQTEGISYTDNEWMYYPQCYVKTCQYINCNLYRYFWGREGQTMSPEARKKANPALFKLLKNMIIYAEHIPIYQQSQEGYKRLIDFISHTSLGIYKDYLVNKSNEEYKDTELKEFDDFIAKHNKDIFDELATIAVLKGVPIRYITYWRKHGRRFPVDIFRNLYRRIRYGR